MSAFDYADGHGLSVTASLWLSVQLTAQTAIPQS